MIVFWLLGFVCGSFPLFFVFRSLSSNRIQTSVTYQVVTPTMDLHFDAVWALATKRDPATQLDLCEQRSKTTLEGTVGQKRFRTVATKYLARPLSRRRIQTVRPPYEKVQVPSQIFPVDTGSAGGILPVGIIAIWSEGAEGVGALGDTSGCHRVSSDSPVLLIHEGS